MAYTYSKIATYTVGSGGVASIDFLNIPQTYTDLLVKFSFRINNLMTSAYCYLNNDTTLANYTDKRLVGSGSAASSSGGSFPRIAISDGTDATASTFGNAEIYIPNYTGSSYKSISADYVAENNGTLGYAGVNAVLWSNTSAINRITFVSGGSESFVQYSTAHLYGIKAEL
jgi:hypothetical protein